MTKVLFLCLGNICRSPTAEAVFRRKAFEAGVAEQFEIDSAGTSDWHVGSPPDQRSAAAALARGVDMSDLRGRQLCDSDFGHYDTILVMDNNNLRDALQRALPESHAKVELFMSYADSSHWPEEVPDPYYGGDNGFEQVLDMLEDAAEGFLRESMA